MVDLSNVHLDELAAAEADVDFGGYKGINVADPGADQDAATKKYHNDNIPVGHTDHQAASAEDADFKSVNIAAGEAYKQDSVNLLRSKATANLFLGENAGINTTGHYNTFIGFEAGYTNISGAKNFFLGYKAGYKNTSSESNTFIGLQAGYSNTTGNMNVFIGNSAGYKNTTGHTNLFLGEYTGYYNTTGYHNMFFGRYAGKSNTVGYRNVFIGYEAGYANTGGNYSVCIGNNAGRNNTSSNRLYIASNYTDAKTLIHGEFDNKYLFHKGAAAAPADAKLHNSDINFWIDETNNRLKIKLKKSDGTVLTGEVQLA